MFRTWHVGWRRKPSLQDLGGIGYPGKGLRYAANYAALYGLAELLLATSCIRRLKPRRELPSTAPSSAFASRTLGYGSCWLGAEFDPLGIY